MKLLLGVILMNVIRLLSDRCFNVFCVSELLCIWTLCVGLGDVALVNCGSM